MPKVRRPSHAGSWYCGSGEELAREIGEWLHAADAPVSAAPVRAIIGPHAGHRYCGAVMAHAYKPIDPASVSRVFLLGPSHHMFTPDCLLSRAAAYQTPLGDVEIDADTYAELQATGMFKTMSLSADEAEHSLELHMPFIAHIFRSQPIKLVPIMVGALTPQRCLLGGLPHRTSTNPPWLLICLRLREAEYGRALAKYLDDPRTLIIVSSDFCHWGDRFNFTFYDEHQGPIYKSIEWLDRLGMDIIEKGNPAEFTSYLRQYGNTICGRHPIGVLLQMLHASPSKHDLQFNQYAQSSQCTHILDSSVSYASAVVSAPG